MKRLGVALALSLSCILLVTCTKSKEGSSPQRSSSLLPTSAELHGDPEEVRLAVTAAIETYYQGITEGDYQSAWNTMTPDRQARQGSFEKWRAGNQSSLIFDLTFLSVDPAGGGTWVARATFRSEQDPGFGPTERPSETCTLWDLDHTVIESAGEWLIEASAAHMPGQGSSPCVQSPEPLPTSEPDECDPSYPDVCISPPPPDLNCADVQYEDFAVRGSDPHGFDGDDDGVGCET